MNTTTTITTKDNRGKWQNCLPMFFDISTWQKTLHNGKPNAETEAYTINFYRPTFA